MPAITDDTIRFIDLSKWQHPDALSWDKLPQDVSAVIARASCGLQTDTRFLAHFDATVDAVRSPGAYHFVTYDDADKQWAAFSLQLELAGYGDPGDVLPVLDCEWLPGEKHPRDAAAMRQIVDALLAHAERDFGGAIVYTATGYWQQCGKPASWTSGVVKANWIAHYPGDRSEAGARAFAIKALAPQGAGNWQMWQSGPRLIPGFCKTKIDYNYSSIPLPTIGSVR